MKSIRVFLLALTAFFLLGCDVEQPINYELTFPTINGETVTLTDHRGKWLVINYWASWCKPCETEIPELNNLAAAHPEQLTLLGVSYDLKDDEEKVSLAEKMGIQFKTLSVDPAPELSISNVPALPATFIFNPEGKLIASLVGEQTQAALEAKMGLG